MPLFEQEKYYKIQAHVAVSAISLYTDYFQRLLGCYAGTGNQTGKVWTKGHHKFIPSGSVGDVISCLRLVREYLMDKQLEQHNCRRPIKFVDCGCGVGNILLLAIAIGGYKVTGLEYEPEAVEIAQLLARHYCDDGNILQQDILTYEDYKLYDVIYYYQPISTSKEMNRFAKKVNNDIKVGAVVMTYGGGSSVLKNDKRFKGVFTRFNSVPENIRRMAWEKVKE
jgi:SAM-dependent methyltransferase